LQILNPNPIRIRYQLPFKQSDSCLSPGKYMSTKETVTFFFSKHKIQIQSGFGYRKENLTPDPVGSSRNPDPNNPKSSPCAPRWLRESYDYMRTEGSQCKEKRKHHRKRHSKATSMHLEVRALFCQNSW